MCKDYFKQYCLCDTLISSSLNGRKKDKMTMLWLHVKSPLHFPGPLLAHPIAVQNKIPIFPLKNIYSTFPDIILSNNFLIN